MNAKLHRPASLVLAGAIAFGLAACGNGPGTLAQPSVSPEGSETIDQVVNTVTPSATGGGGSSPTPPATLTTSPTQAPVQPSPEDCISYDPANLTVVASGDAWILRSGASSMKIFDTYGDAEDARRVARNWQQLCWIGRGNQGPDRYRHMVHYFQQPSGLPLGAAPTTLDCITYNPNDLDIYHGPAHPAIPDEDDWALFSGSIPLLFLATEPNALRARIVASEHTRLCFIGAGNDRPDPFRYRMTWWRQ